MAIPRGQSATNDEPRWPDLLRIAFYTYMRAMMRLTIIAPETWMVFDCELLINMPVRRLHFWKMMPVTLTFGAMTLKSLGSRGHDIQQLWCFITRNLAVAERPCDCYVCQRWPNTDRNRNWRTEGIGNTLRCITCSRTVKMCPCILEIGEKILLKKSIWPRDLDLDLSPFDLKI